MTTATKTTTTHRLTTGRLIAMGIGLAIPITVLLRIAQEFLADPINMLTGLLFGILAGVPAALLVFATSSHRRELERDEDERRHTVSQAQPLHAPPCAPPAYTPPPLSPEAIARAQASSRRSMEHWRRRMLAGDYGVEPQEAVRIVAEYDAREAQEETV